MDNVNKPAALSVAATATVCIAMVTLLVLLGGLAWWLWGTDRATEWEALRPLIAACFIVWGVALSLLVLGFMAFRLLIKDKVSSPVSRQRQPAPESQREAIYAPLKNHLFRRYKLFWYRKVRLLLVVGDEAAIEQLVPGLQAGQWLEGERTVLIYGGSLTAEVDTEKYTALRKLRRSRPLDAIVRVLGEGENLTLQMSDNDLRGLEKIGEALRYSAPVWLWQLCGSEWSQAGRKLQSVGITLPLRAMPEQVAIQLEKLLPQLREQGMSQIAEQRQYDFLLRLAQQLEQGESKRWMSRLTPWLYGSQQRIPLRGLMFSPVNKPGSPSEEAGKNVAESAVLPAHKHALTFPATWQGVMEDCTRVRGRRVGMAWEQILAWGIMAVLGIWGAGLLLSFSLNYSQISSVANKARSLVEHPSVSDSQLTALHGLRNDAGRLQHHVQGGSPWYQRFGLDHNPQLLSAMLPWYGVANNRLIRDPANAALMQKLTALTNSAPNSDQRTQLAKPGYDQLKAWLMMARPDKADGAFYAQTMKDVQPSRTGTRPDKKTAPAPTKKTKPHSTKKETGVSKTKTGSAKRDKGLGDARLQPVAPPPDVQAQCINSKNFNAYWEAVTKRCLDRSTGRELSTP